MLKRRLAVEPALAARLEELERANSALRNAYAGIAAEPLPQRVLDLIDAAPRATTASVVDITTRRQTRERRFAPLPMSLAAGIALAVGLGAGYLVTSRPPTSTIPASG